MDRNIIKDFREILIELYPDEMSIRRVLSDAGVDTSLMVLTGSAMNTWHSVLTELSKQNKIKALLTIVHRDYSENQKFSRIYNDYKQRDKEETHCLFNGLSKRQCYSIRVALLLTLGVISVTSFIVARRLALHTCPPQTICILVADFTPIENQTSRDFALKLRNEIQLQLDQSATERVMVKQTLTPIQTAEEAKAVARAEGALLVVWGQVMMLDAKSPRFTVYFQLADLLGVGEAQGARPNRSQPLFYDAIGEYCADCLYVEAAQRVTVVAQTVAGLTHYAQSRPEQAQFDFLSALYCAGESLEQDVILRLQPTCQPSTQNSNWNSGLLYYYLGKTLTLQGDYAHAIQFLTRATVVNSQDPAAWIGIGTAYQSWLAQSDADEAADALHRAEFIGLNLIDKVTPEIRPIVHYNLGLTYELLTNFVQAEKHYQQAISGFSRVGDSEYTSLIGLARVQEKINNQSTAIETLQQAHNLEPTQPWAYLALAIIQQKTIGQAKAYLKQAKTNSPEEASVYITEFELCQIWEEYNCAMRAFAYALVLRPDSGWLYSKIGEFYLPTTPVLSHQSWIEAEKYFQRAAAELRPQDPWSHERLAYVLLNQQAYAEAAKEYEKTIQLSYHQIVPSGLYCNQGIAYQRMNLLSQARSNFKHCAQLATTQEQRARAEELLRELPESIENSN